MRIFCAVDNGVSATIGAVREDGEWTAFFKVPTYKAQEYMRSKTRFMTHVDYDEMLKTLKAFMGEGELVLVTERPMVNPTRFKATMSGVRAHEILLASLRTLGVELYATWDSRDWQAAMLGDFEKGGSKPASMKKGCELFPEHETLIRKHKDADGILMAQHLMDTVLAEEKKQKKPKKKGDQ